jgi:hypothetical protein
LPPASRTRGSEAVASRANTLCVNALVTESRERQRERWCDFVTKAIWRMPGSS